MSLIKAFLKNDFLFSILLFLYRLYLPDLELYSGSEKS